MTSLSDHEPTVEDLALLIRDTFALLSHNGTNGLEREDPHSWTPVDLVTVANNPPEPPTISGLVYPGRRHLFSGEPESLKSWAAMVLCLEQIREGRTAMYVDFEMGGRETLARLRDLGADDDELRDHFIYLEPDESFLDTEIQRDTVLLLAEQQPALIIIDAFTGALQTHQLDPNKSTDVEAFYRKVVDPLRAHGAAVVILDHLAKDVMTRGKFAIGSERKVGGAEVHLGFEVITPFGRGRAGAAKITTHKDRPGYLPRPRAAQLELHSDSAGRVTWKISEPETYDADHPFEPTTYMEKISRYLELYPDKSFSRNQIEQAVSGKADWIRKAIDFLEMHGHIHQETGARGAKLITFATPYNPPRPTSSPPRPDEEKEMTSSTSSPPDNRTRSSRDEDEVEQPTQLVPWDEVEFPATPDADIPF